jgi:hypothetical protein
MPIFWNSDFYLIRMGRLPSFEKHVFWFWWFVHRINDGLVKLGPELETFCLLFCKSTNEIQAIWYIALNSYQRRKMKILDIELDVSWSACLQIHAIFFCIDKLLYDLILWWCYTILEINCKLILVLSTIFTFSLSNFYVVDFFPLATGHWMLLLAIWWGFSICMHSTLWGKDGEAMTTQVWNTGLGYCLNAL